MHKAQRIKNADSADLLVLLEKFRPIEAVVETCLAWPWLFDPLTPHGFGFVLAHAKELRVISGQNYKRDDMDAELLARIRVAAADIFGSRPCRGCSVVGVRGSPRTPPMRRTPRRHQG